MKGIKSPLFMMLFVMVIASFTLLPAVYAEDVVGSDEYEGAYYYGEAYDQARQWADESDAKYTPVGDVPEVGEGQAVGYVDDEGNYHSY